MAGAGDNVQANGAAGIEVSEDRVAAGDAAVVIKLGDADLVDNLVPDDPDGIFEVGIGINGLAERPGTP